MDDTDLIAAIERMGSLMISVATGGPRIEVVNPEFQRLDGIVAGELSRRGLGNPLPYRSLWDWHGRWSQGDLPTYKSRRSFIGEIVNPLVTQIRTGRTEAPLPTGWTRVDRTVEELRSRLIAARTEEQFQAVGLLGREALISLAQAVFDGELHEVPDGVTPSDSDARRMLEGFLGTELAGGTNEEARKHAKSAFALAVALQHRRTATFRDAALCVEAAVSVVNIVAIVSGRRDPQ